MCVSECTLRNYPHDRGIVFITTAVIRHTANENQQAGTEQASPLFIPVHMYGMGQDGQLMHLCVTR